MRRTPKPKVFLHGRTISFECARCHKNFQWKITEEKWWEHIPQFCSKDCRKRSQHSRRFAEEFVPCPNPYKKSYSRYEPAHEEAIIQCKGQQKLYSAYRCVCGGWHVGHRPHRLVA